MLGTVPETLRWRLLKPAPASPSSPGLRIGLSGAAGNLIDVDVATSGLAHAALADAEAVVVSDGTALQVVGFSHRTDAMISMAVDHSRACGPDRQVRVDVDADGGASVDVVGPDGHRQPVASVGRPWAIDAQGKELRTWYEANGPFLRQLVDTAGAQAPVMFDPTYTFLNCAGHWGDIDTYWYLNINADDTGYCPVMGMFTARNGYRPVFGFETNVANDFGRIALKEGGGCTSSPDTGPFSDFQVPCKAHDYCYDLRKAGFSGTVSDASCDDWFFWIMEAHCNDRVLANHCRSVRDSYWAAVRAPWVVTDPDPAAIPIWNLNSGQCIDVDNGSTGDGVADRGNSPLSITEIPQLTRGPGGFA